jgi:hypothetical protein
MTCQFGRTSVQKPVKPVLFRNVPSVQHMNSRYIKKKKKKKKKKKEKKRKKERKRKKKEGVYSEKLDPRVFNQEESVPREV